MKIGDLIQVKEPLIFDEYDLFGLIVDSKKIKSDSGSILSGSQSQGNFCVLWFDGEFSWESKKCLEMITRQTSNTRLALSSSIASR